MRITGHVHYPRAVKPTVEATYRSTSKHVSTGAAWSLQDEQTLLAMWGTHTCRQIAIRLGRSRNAIIGKAHRLNADKKPSPIKRAA